MGLLLSAASTMALAAAQKGPPVNVLCSVWLELELMGLAGTAMSAAVAVGVAGAGASVSLSYNQFSQQTQK